MGAQVTAYGDGLADRVRDQAGGPVDLVFDASPPTAGSISELIATVDDPSRVMTIGNHGDAPASTFMPEHAALAADGAFRLPIARTYALAEWRDAVKLSMSGHPHGKVMLLP